MMMMMMMMMMTMIVPMGFTNTIPGKTPPPKPAWAKEIIADFCITPPPHMLGRKKSSLIFSTG